MTLADWHRQHPPPVERLTQTLAGVAERACNGEPWIFCVREFLDEWPLRTTAALRAAAIEAEPAPIDPVADAYLAAIAEHLTAILGEAPPPWVGSPNRFLDRFWFASTVPGFRATLIARSPAAFRRRGLFVDSSTLTRV